MATPNTVERCLRLFSVFVYAVVCLATSTHGIFIVTHAPKHVSFLSDANALQSSEVPHVISATFGFQLNKDISWNGLGLGSLFQRPKANVLIEVEGVPSGELNIQHMAKYNLAQDVMEIDTESVVSQIQSLSQEEEPVIMDFSIDSTVFDVRSRHPALFRKLPATYSKIREAFQAHQFGFSPASLGSLNVTHEADLLFLGELHIMQEIIKALRDNPDTVKSAMADFYHFKLRGMGSLTQAHGAQSSQVQDAITLLQTVLDKMTEEFKALYSGNVVVEVASIPVPDRHEFHARKSRSLLEDPPQGGQEAKPTQSPPSPPGLNLADNYDELYPVVFNIILWFMIVFILAILGISYGIWFMDPGRDSIIYRMTSTRMKKD